MKVYYTIFILLLSYFSYAQTNISGIINSYTPVTTISSVCPDSLQVAGTTGFAAGDSVVIIQMQGADIDSTNSNSFGTINSYNDAGNYEFAKINSINGNTIHLTSSLARSYNLTGNVQLVSYPVYADAIVTATLTAQSWNGSTGGVLAFSVSNSLTLNADIDITGKGFRGGSASPNYYITWCTDYCFSSVPGRGGKKGEGIAAYFLNKEYGRGPQANGGGSGNDINTGAAGGGNYGAGGHGGNNYFAPDTLWGLRGKSLASGINQNQLFFGGGGGGGHQNNSEGTDGGNGGGIIIVRANNMTGNNYSIKNNGDDVSLIAGIDGAGGGGAGGSTIIDAANFLTNLNIEVKGGKGGDQNYPPQCHGNGGGGGGGALIYSGSSFPGNVTTRVTGGVMGVGQCNNTPDDAANGDSGIVIYNWSAPQISIIVNAGPDVTICPGNQVQIGTVAQPGLFYMWDTGASSALLTVNPVVTTSYILRVTEGACHFGFDTVVVNVSPVPVSSFTYNATCNSITFNNNSGTNSCLWYFGDGDTTTILDPVHDFINSGIYQVSLVSINGNGCADSISQNVTVNQQLVQPAFSVNAQPCNNTSIQFNNQSQNSTQFVWNFGDGITDTITNPLHQYVWPGNYSVTLISLNVCDTDSVSLPVSVDTVIVAGFSYLMDTCTAELSFNNSSLHAANFIWEFGDGNSSAIQNPDHTYFHSGNYQVSLISISNSGCRDSAIANLFIPPKQVATISYHNTTCDSLFYFINQSSNASVSQWDFGDGSTSSVFNPDHIYSMSGNMPVQLISMSQYGCRDTVNRNVYVTIPVPADFNFIVDSCSDQIYFANKSPFAISYTWDFGDNAFSKQDNPVHKYNSTGEYNVELVVNAGTNCPAKTSKRLVFTTESKVFYIPNSFTPNGDGINDVFKIISINPCGIYSMTIFDRWGKKIFETNDPLNHGWDGLYMGRPAPEGVYVYLLDGAESQKTGSIAIIR